MAAKLLNAASYAPIQVKCSTIIIGFHTHTLRQINSIGTRLPR